VQILPSFRTPAARGPAGQGRAGLELAPFRGVRYVPDRVSGLAEVSSPPYDVIFEDKEDQLMAADPHNVVRLILPRPVAERPGEEYLHAAESLRQWQDEGILATDPEPALYVYEQAVIASGLDDQPESAPGQVRPGSVQPGLIQRGLIGAVALAPPEAGVVLPHEDVNPGPVAGRLALMEATQANLEPIFLLYDGGESGRPGAAARLVAETAAAAEPLAQALTPDGVRHRLWAITDADLLAAIAADLAPRQALIADGHHRYAAYRQLQDRRHRSGAGSGPWDYGLALLVDSAAYPPQIGAIHRVIPNLGVPDAAKLAGAAFAVRSLPGGMADLDSVVGALARASASGPAFVVADGEHAYLLTNPDPRQTDAAMSASRSPQWRALPAALLQELLITRLWGLTDDERAVRVVHHDAEAAVRAAHAACGSAVLCSPMLPRDVYAVAARGEKVPRKSTSFAPKPRTGLIMRMFAQS
jgi:uncharacterized protein (DUF1015 family)